MTQVPSLSNPSSKPQDAIAPPSSRQTTRWAQWSSTAMDLKQSFSSWSLRQQLLAAVLPLALVPLFLEGLINYTLTQGRTRANINQALQGQALLASETVEGNLAEEILFIELFTQNPTVLDKVRRGSALTASENLTSVPKDRLEARFIVPKQLAPNADFNAYLTKTANRKQFAEIIVTEENGLNVGYSSLPSDFVQKNDAWFQQALAAGIWFSDPGYDDSTFRVGIDLSHAIRDPATGEFLGVAKFFLTALEFEQINTYLANAGIRGSQQVQLLDASAQYVLANFNEQGQDVALTPRSLDLIGGEVVQDMATRLTEAARADTLPEAEELQRQLRSALPVRDLQVSVVNAQPGEASSPGSLVASFRYQGKKYAMASVPSLDWVAVSSMDMAEVRAAGQGTLITLGLLVLVLGGVAAVLTGAVSRQLAQPLDNLASTAEAVSQGNLDVSAELQGSSEARTLAQTFNTLVFRIRGFLREQALNTRQASLAAEITGAKIESSAALAQVYDRLVTEARDILQADRVVIYRFNADWSGRVVAESMAETLPSAFAQQLGDPCIPQATLDKYTADGFLMETDVARANLHPEHLTLLRSLEVKSILGVPVISQSQLYGLLITHHCHTTHQWQDNEISFMKQIGLQLGLVVERVSLLEQTQALAEEQRQIKEGLQRNALQLLMDVDPVRQGDLTVRAKVTEDEIGTVADSYNATVSSLRKIVVQVQEAAQQVATTTDTNQGSVRSLATSAAQQASEILAALERVEAMANSVRLVATNAEKAEAAVRQAAQTVTQGDDAMNRTVEGIMAIRETVADTAKKVKRLGESSQKISNVVNLISGFAAQTNMLALNASIEASRAGEGGKGFAVVAEEVRELARQSTEATTEIEKLVASIQAETNAVVTAMESGTEQVVTGTQLVDETRQSLNQITAVSQQISALVESIAAATVEQTQASEVVTETMNKVATTANQNSAAATQVSDAFEQLRSVAQALQDEVGRFKVAS